LIVGRLDKGELLYIGSWRDFLRMTTRYPQASFAVARSQQTDEIRSREIAKGAMGKATSARGCGIPRQDRPRLSRHPSFKGTREDLRKRDLGK
jgi:hypothetical protein